MPHIRSRYLSATIRKELKWSPSIGILGMRQTGKTTLIQGFFKSYYSFDSIDAFSQFEKSSENILSAGPFPMGLDEVQKFPSLFDSLKLQMDRKKIPGRYLLTGSVRFSSKKDIRESLTGRISLLELLPFTIAESHGRNVSSFLSDILKFDGEGLLSMRESKVWATTTQIQHYIETGGLPGISFKRDSNVREKLFKNHLDTLFGRDIHLIYQTTLSITKLEELYSLLCETQGEFINYLRLARQLGSTAPTIRKVVDAMESLFLVRRYGKTLFAEDLGLASFAMRFKTEPSRQRILRFIFSEIRSQIQYLFPTECQLTPYSTRGGIDIPFLVKTKNGTTIAVCVEGDEIISDKTSKGITWFRKKYPRTKAVVFYLGKKPYLSPSGVPCLPWTWAC